MDPDIRHVYVISDLHLGGAAPSSNTTGDRGFRINTHVHELASFIREVKDNASAGALTELVINGDVVDFLAEWEDLPPHWLPFTSQPDTACKKLADIVQREAEFFHSLRDFLDAGHRVVLLPGNHDIELALPEVRHKLYELIGIRGSHDFEFLMHGEAYIVGNALIEHGHRYDCWNAVDYDGLRRFCSLQSRRQMTPPKYGFRPPAGSLLVSWVINPIKENYRFIDLLKPETAAAVPLLLAVEPGFASKIATVAGLALQAREHRLETPSMPSYGSDVSSGGGSGALETTLREVLGDDATQFQQQIGITEEDNIGGDVASSDFIDRTWGLWQLMMRKKDDKIEKRIPALLNAIRHLQDDHSFDRSAETALEYLNAAIDLTKNAFRYVVFGHTHLAKRVDLENGCCYLNSGAWVDLLRIPPDLFRDATRVHENLKRFVQDMATNSFAEWLHYQPTYVHLEVRNDQVVHADLCEYSLRGNVVAAK